MFHKGSALFFLSLTVVWTHCDGAKECWLPSNKMSIRARTIDCALRCLLAIHVCPPGGHPLALPHCVGVPAVIT